jgi:curved DNA-binding protein CbpA
MDDYYSLLGIDADASVDDIRGAYRLRKDGLDTATDAGKADAAKLNKAWNVLSDPYQRGRYDEKRAEAADRGDVDDGDDDASSNGSSSKSSATGFKGLQASAKSSRQERAQSTRDARAARLNKTPTIALPPGTSWPSTRQRIVAMVIDLVVLLVIFIVISQIGANALAKAQKPAIVDKANSLNDQINTANKQKSDADALVSADKKANNTAKQATDQKTSDALKTQITNLTKQHDDELAKLNAYFLGGLALSFFLGFLYLAVPSALTGATLGKRTQHLKALREDGSPLGPRGAVTRYGLVILVTMSFYVLLREVAAVLVLFGVTMWMRNPNMQGLHDRLAHTIVVREAD